MSGKNYEKHLRLAPAFLANAPAGEFEMLDADLEGRYTRTLKTFHFFGDQMAGH
jgi:hypothetical protein